MIERVEHDTRPLLLALGLGGILALSLVFLPAPQSLLAIFAGAVALLAVSNRRAALYLILPAIALSPDIPILGVPLRIEDLLMVPIVIGWIAHLFVFGDRHRTPLDRILVAYLTVGLLASLWGAYLGTAHFATIAKDYSAPFHLLKRLEFVLLFFIVCDTFTTTRDVRWMSYVLMASMLWLSGFQLAEYFNVVAAGPADPGHEAGLASMLNVALALSLFPAATRPAKFVLFAVILFSMAVLPLTQGRNYMATTAIIMLYIGLFQQRWVLALFPVFLLMSPHLYTPEIVTRFQTLQYVFVPDVTGTMYQGASLISRTGPGSYYGLIALGNSPILGFGLASLSLGHFDSEYVTQFFYTGIVGVCVFLVLGAGLWRLSRDVERMARTPLDTGLARGFHLIWIAYAAHSIFSPSISASRVGAVFFVVAGLLMVLYRSLTEPESVRGRR